MSGVSGVWISGSPAAAGAGASGVPDPRMSLAASCLESGILELIDEKACKRPGVDGVEQESFGFLRLSSSKKGAMLPTRLRPLDDDNWCSRSISRSCEVASFTGSDA